jgi:phosphoenolpyruvate carboxykinase (ATP)
LSSEKEPDIFAAIKPGSLLENIVFKRDSDEVDFNNATTTPNTRVSYPIDYIKNIQHPSIGENPRNIFFLTADAFGVLPPISKLTPAQAAYHFISGYTAKVAGTEEGINEPLPSFSACFGAPFMPLHPSKYAELLSEKMKETGVNVWLINTGWVGGPYGVGNRISLTYTRAMITAVLNGELDNFTDDQYHIHTIFGLAQPKECPNVPNDILSQKTTWNNDKAYYKQAKLLAKSFNKNFEKFAEFTNKEILSGGPVFT